MNDSILDCMAEDLFSDMIRAIELTLDVNAWMPIRWSEIECLLS